MTPYQIKLMFKLLLLIAKVLAWRQQGPFQPVIDEAEKEIARK